MTDAAPGTAAPPKKRSFFKKAAWQTAPKAEAEKEHDMFSHSNEFRDIVAEETQRKNEERKKLEEERKRKLEQERERKRRRLSNEEEETKLPRDGFGSSPRSRKLQSKGRSKTPPSPNDSRKDTLFHRYDSLTKIASSGGSFTKKESDIINLGDSDDDYVPPYIASPTPAKQSIPIHSSKGIPSEDVEETEDPQLAALKAKARARAAERALRKEQESTKESNEQNGKVPVVQLFITSLIPDTNPLIVKVKIDTTIGKPKEAWCKKQGFTPSQTQDIFMTFKERRVYDSTTVRKLGLHEDDNGNLIVTGDPTIYDEHNLPKIHVGAWTEEAFKKWQKEEAEEAAARKKAIEAPTITEEPESEPEAETRGQKIKLVLKAKGRDDFKIVVKPDTDFGHLAHAYKKACGVPEEQPITFMLDGERLPPMDTIADTDIEDMDSIEVHFK